MLLRGLGILLVLPGSAPQEQPPAPRDAEFRKDIRPILEAHCFTCHGPKKKKAGVDLSAADSEAAMARDGKTWLAALHQLRNRAMPPGDEKKQPSDADREKLVAWLDGAMDRIDARAPRDPGRTTLRRLNRAEYDNTVRDLTGIDLRLAEDFPADDAGDGFDTVGDALSLPPLLLEKLLDAADRILEKAMVAEGPVPFLEKRIEAEALVKNAGGRTAVEMKLEEELSTPVSIPADGRYELRVRASQERGVDGAAILVIKVDGVDSALIPVQAGPGSASVHSALVFFQAGERRLAFRHTPPRAYGKDETVPDVRLTLDWADLAGPDRSLSHRRIFFVEPVAGKEREAAQSILGRFARLAFRRPVEPVELGRTMGLYDAARAQKQGFAAAVRQGLWSILVSPHFLYRVERDSANRDVSGAVRLNDWELASRLSYFLWSTMPDEALFELASRGRLRDPAVLREQARRMLADPRSRALTDNFAAQWLGLRRLEHTHPDRDLFPAFTETLRRAMVDEVRLTFDAIVREDRSILELLDSGSTFLNEPLARHYGIKDVKGDAMRRVTLSDRRRGGVMSMGAILTLTSHPTRTSAVKRGKWILDEILGAPPPPPPPDVPELDQAVKNRPDAAKLTLRQRMELHRSDPQCHGCHKRMDVLGLGFENFDPVGRWRDRDAGSAIDSSGTLPTGETFSGPAELKRLLAGCEADFARTLVEKMFVYALGRTMERSDRREIRRVVEELRRNGWRYSALVEGVVTSYPFLYRRAATLEETR